MASRAILKRRRFIDHYVNVSTRSIINSQWDVIAVDNLNSHLQTSSLNAPTHFKHIKDYDSISLPKEESFNLSALGQYRQRCYEITRSVPTDHRLGSNTLKSIRWLSQSLHSFSTAAAKQPELGGDDEKSDEMVAKKRKEASPEECDQAVEGLSTAKAKAKAKRLQEPQKVVQTILKRIWAVVLGIGPAFRAVVSMSREDWVKKLVHWKNEFISTLQHYWLGCKLLWADVRICSRLLLKLAGGKSLSRREKQQLTRTTADIFRLVPVAVFVLVPFMEFLLPVFLKLFPNMLPSTFQDKMKEQVLIVLDIAKPIYICCLSDFYNFLGFLELLFPVSKIQLQIMLGFEKS